MVWWMIASALGAPLNERDVQKQSCENGEAKECTALGLRYQRGTGAPLDPHFALELFRKGCTLGDEVACVYQADAYRNGDGVVRDATRAVSLYTNACAKEGLGRACRALGDLYILGDGVPRDAGASMLWYEQGCDNADAESCVGAALGVERGDLMTADPRKGRAMLVRSCQELKHARGCTLLGRRYLDGLDGAEKSIDLAAVMFSLGCELGDAESCRHVGLMTMKGKGVPKDFDAARLYLTDACGWDDYIGCRGLADLLKKSDLQKAAAAAKHGCELGDTPSCTKQRTLEWKISLQQ
ncbi:MAG: tetratricopeptide repeat protein [Myxococcota bacterium]